MALIDLYLHWEDEGEVFSDGPDSYTNWLGTLFIVDPATLVITTEPRRQRVYLTPVPDVPPADVSLDPSVLISTQVNGNTLTRYYHDGAGGLAPLAQFVDATATVIGCDCFGTAVGLIDLTLAPDSPGGSYTYLWSDGATTADRGAMRAGTYSVLITHESGAWLLLENVVVGQNPRLEVEVRQLSSEVELVVSGGVAPYSFLWNDGDTRPQRDDLVEGTSTCTVTDSLGCVREVTVSYFSYQLFFSRNAIYQHQDAGEAYREDPAGMPNLSFVCEVHVEQEYGSNLFTPVATVLEQPASRDGRTVFEVQELLSPFLQPAVPNLAQTGIERRTDVFKRFFLRTAPKYGTPPTRDAVSVSAVHFVQLGGLSFHEARSGNWASYAAARRPFLTWQPSTVYAAADQPEFLSWLVLASFASLQQKVKVYFSDGSTTLLTPSGFTQPVVRGEVLNLPAGFAQLGLDDQAERTVTAWEVFLADTNGQAVSPVRRYVREWPVGPRRYLLYRNSLGGVDTFVATGEAVLDVEVTGDEVERSLAWDYDPQLGDTQVQDKVLRPLLKLASGLRTQQQMLEHQELLLSRQVLLVQHGQLRPGVVKAKTVPLTEEGKYVNSLELDFYLPRERNFTPRLPAAGGELPTFDQLLP
ncbi:SprB repeat-containing protein [Hymenobacter psychrotolerans]|uniref:SprB repeat-containing protein n=1 Tax=Hymenobacter psychrotolerans DSM 18569 TaxID=1121959 RepID=A0A1M7E8C0_9BACT|nr:SprB repeat-containing protein [Hymenobacter psychrotolerans]SHL88012.1 SprB repeat-containing protein [Hymenobacter psychrotolerans DSM 18569]